MPAPPAAKLKNNPIVQRGVRDVDREGGLLFCAVPGAPCMNLHLINPSSVSCGTAVLTPRWQYVLAAARPKSFVEPILVDEALDPMGPERMQKGDAVGI